MAIEITEEQREAAQVAALTAEGPWLSPSGMTAFEHEKAGALSVLTALGLTQALGQPITNELLLNMLDNLSKATEEEVYGKPPVEGPFEA